MIETMVRSDVARRRSQEILGCREGRLRVSCLSVAMKPNAPIAEFRHSKSANELVKASKFRRAYSKIKAGDLKNSEWVLKADVRVPSKGGSDALTRMSCDVNSSPARWWAVLLKAYPTR